MSIQVKKIFLTEAELNKLAVTKCPKNNHVKKAFLFSCNTGLRYSDVAKLKWENIKNDHLFVTGKLWPVLYEIEIMP